jgi:hypothetical protein
MRLYNVKISYLKENGQSVNFMAFKGKSKLIKNEY